MALIRRPYDVLGFRRDFDNLFSSFLGDTENDSMSQNSWNPQIDIADDNDNFYINAEIPGIDKDDIKINIKGNTLTINGEKKAEKESKGKNYYRSERVFGSFARTFELPEAIDREKISANYTNGILKLTVPKTEEAKPKEIEVKIK